MTMSNLQNMQPFTDRSNELPFETKIRTTPYVLLLVAVHYFTQKDLALTSGNLHAILNQQHRLQTARKSATSNIIKKSPLLDSCEFSNLGTSGGRIFQVNFIPAVEKILLDMQQLTLPLEEQIEQFLHAIHAPVLRKHISTMLETYSEYCQQNREKIPTIASKKPLATIFEQ